MGRLQKALNEVLSELPRRYFREFINQKLLKNGIKAPVELLDKLTDHIMISNKDDFVWDGDLPGRENGIVNLNFDDEDLRELDNLVESLPDRIKILASDSIEVGGKILFRQLAADWTSYGETQRVDLSDFTDRLSDRWGDGLKYLRMLLTVVREMGQETAKRHRRSKSKSHIHRRFILMRLHLRACQIADEIITLLENGFADGAMARWRTLYEIDVVATVIEDGDEELAQRFIDHQVVDQKKMIDNWDETQIPLGYSAVDMKTRGEIERRFQGLIDLYGSEFKNEYGWASRHLNLKRPDFKAMQHASQQSAMSAYYKLANNNVHATSRSMFVRLTDMGDDVPIAGRSNAGLLEPGQNTAFTLTRITAALLGRTRGLDQLIKVRALTMMRDAAQTALQRADRRLRKDEFALRRAQKKSSVARSKPRRPAPDIS